MTLHLSVIFYNSPPGKGLNGDQQLQHAAYMLNSAAGIVKNTSTTNTAFLSLELLKSSPHRLEFQRIVYQVGLELTRFGRRWSRR
jgi:precorrin-6B methylase 2